MCFFLCFLSLMQRTIFYSKIFLISCPFCFKKFAALTTIEKNWEFSSFHILEWCEKLLSLFFTSPILSALNFSKNFIFFSFSLRILWLDIDLVQVFKCKQPLYHLFLKFLFKNKFLTSFCSFCSFFDSLTKKNQKREKFKTMLAKEITI